MAGIYLTLEWEKEALNKSISTRVILDCDECPEDYVIGYKGWWGLFQIRWPRKASARVTSERS